VLLTGRSIGDKAESERLDRGVFKVIDHLWESIGGGGSGRVAGFGLDPRDLGGDGFEPCVCEGGVCRGKAVWNRSAVEEKYQAWRE